MTLSRQLAPVLEKWSFTAVAPRGTDPDYCPPECRRPCLQGNVHGHPNFPDGQFIITSPLVGYDPLTDEFICNSRRYKLGTVDPGYETEFSPAKQRLIDSLLRKVNHELQNRQE